MRDDYTGLFHHRAGGSFRARSHHRSLQTGLYIGIQAYVAADSADWHTHSYDDDQGLEGEEKACFALESKLCEQLFVGVKAVLEGKELGWQAAYPYIYTKLIFGGVLSCSPFYSAQNHRIK